MYFDSQLIKGHDATERLVDNILKKLSLCRPINIELLLKVLKGRLLFVEGLQYTVIDKTKRRFRISIGETDKNKLQEIIAKAIFHWLVHMKDTSVYADSPQRRGVDWRYENHLAEYFALCLFMGKESFYDSIANSSVNGRYFEVKKVAEAFNVSEDMVKRWTKTTGAGIVI